MTSQRPLASALDRVFPHLLILLYSLGAAVIYDHHWPFRGHGDNPILDLVDFHHPAFYKALEIWHYLAPVVAAYLAALVLPSALTLIARWRSPWKTFLRLPWNIFLRLLNLIQISTQHTALLLFAFTVAWLHYYYRPFTQHSEDPLLVLIAVHDPGFYTAITVWYYLAPGVAVLLAGLLLLSVYRVWIATDGPQAARGALPSWLDSYSLAYTISSLLNPLFGKGLLKEPFWQQAGLAPEAGSQDAQSTSAGCREREILPDPEPVLVSTPYKHGSLPERLYSHRHAHTCWRYRGRYNGWVRRIHLKGVLQVENVQFEVVEGNRLVIHVDLNHRGDISASGKTRRVASTLGNVSVKDANGLEIKIGLNVYVKPDV